MPFLMALWQGVVYSSSLLGSEYIGYSWQMYTLGSLLIALVPRTVLGARNATVFGTLLGLQGVGREASSV